MLLIIPGSSPLARGLRSVIEHDGLLPGIIPARAGFTQGCGPVDSKTWDHPRSRGVYVHRKRGGVSGDGSSPLARGLPGPRKCATDTRRIIPARAGFTATHRTIGQGDRDHPRSRGVYEPVILNLLNTQGSSPLARGLPTDTRLRPRAPRIIPARAGFTNAASPKGNRQQDHPRSRGVY